MNDPGKVITFYSYKGGTGRTMALANVGVMLARGGAGKVLMIDWDLEAPGLHDFFPELEQRMEDKAQPTPGVLDLFSTAHTRIEERNGEVDPCSLWGEIELDRYILDTDEPSLGLMPAGSFDEHYGTRVNTFSWEKLFESSPTLFKAFADELASRYSYVLIDSRTGFTDSSGICTTLLPDRLVTVFTPNHQSLSGVVDLVKRATTYRSHSSDLRPLLVFPLASRVEMSEEDLRREWRYGRKGVTRGYQPQFEELFKTVYDMPECHLEHYFDEVQIQHATRYAYGERIAVRDESSDRLSLARSYARLERAVIESNGPWTFERDRPPEGDLEVRTKRSIARLREACFQHERHARAARLRVIYTVAAEAAAGFAMLVLLVLGLTFRSSGEGISLVEALPLVILLGAVAGAAHFMRRGFDQRHAIHLLAANSLEREQTLFESNAGPYSGVEDPVALLAERLSKIDAEADDSLFYRKYQYKSGPFEITLGGSKDKPPAE